MSGAANRVWFCGFRPLVSFWTADVSTSHHKMRGVGGHAWPCAGLKSAAAVVQVLGISRVMVAWQPVGVAAGVYDMCVRYAIERRQFDRPLAAFQLVQERLARMAGTLQGMWLSAWRLSELLEAGTMTHAQVRPTPPLQADLLGGPRRVCPARAVLRSRFEKTCVCREGLCML